VLAEWMNDWNWGQTGMPMKPVMMEKPARTMSGKASRRGIRGRGPLRRSGLAGKRHEPEPEHVERGHHRGRHGQDEQWPVARLEDVEDYLVLAPEARKRMMPVMASTR